MRRRVADGDRVGVLDRQVVELAQHAQAHLEIGRVDAAAHRSAGALERVGGEDEALDDVELAAAGRQLERRHAAKSRS